MDDNLYGGRPPFVKGCDTSRSAAEAISHPRGGLQLKVYSAIWNSDAGMTCDEVEEETGMIHQTASARVRELAQRGHIVDSGERRATRSGRAAIVWKSARKQDQEPAGGQQGLFGEGG